MYYLTKIVFGSQNPFERKKIPFSLFPTIPQEFTNILFLGGIIKLSNLVTVQCVKN